MRVISGKYKGKNLLGFGYLGTRPTMDRIKESLFARIQNNVKNAIVLDLFAGSGSLGIEALSNGAKSCYFVDNNYELIDIIKKNTVNIKEEYHIIKNDYNNALNDLREIKFDIIFLDPPYDLLLINDCLKKIKKYNLLNDNGIVVCEYEKETIENDDYILINSKKYGSKVVDIYKLK